MLRIVVSCSDVSMNWKTLFDDYAPATAEDDRIGAFFWGTLLVAIVAVTIYLI